jgi:5-methylcytosine-specific restriction endonuclease McrA
MGLNSYRNLVSCCMECNVRKGETAANDYLRWLYRAQKLAPSEFRGRLQAVKDLKAGKVRPALVKI